MPDSSAPPFPGSVVQRIVLVLIATLFAITNLPWTLDDYDQAKQAYTSFEMVRQGHWLYDHTPNEGVATKPPLVGWISAGLFELTRSWEVAWRLPTLASALGLLWLLGRAATSAYGPMPGFLALSAFGLNLLAPRLATLVRTDMPLALVTFLIGGQIWNKIRRAEEWSARDQVTAFVLLTIALWIKGPIVYAFILPGLVAYQLLRRRSVRDELRESFDQRSSAGARRRGAPPSSLSSSGASAWCGWWPWLVSLALFLAWVLLGIVRQPGFYESVVLKEFAGRFTETVHKPQPFYFYLPHLLHKFAPWSLLLSGLAIAFWRERRSRRMEPATLWLVCWSMGGLLLMSIIPSKRVDRIFPIIPPLCLLLGAQIAAARGHARLRPWLRGALIFACIFASGYAGLKIGSGVRKNTAALVRFSAEVRQRAAEQGWRYAVVGGREEGMLLYLRRDHFLPPEEAVAQWQAGRLNALVVRDQPTPPWVATLPEARRLLVSAPSAATPPYVLLVRQP